MKDSGFSVAFGSTGCNGSAGVRGHAPPPPEIFTIRLSKMQFPTFPEPEWKVFKGVKKCSQKVKYLTDLAIIIISLQLFQF